MALRGPLCSYVCLRKFSCKPRSSASSFLKKCPGLRTKLRRSGDTLNRLASGSDRERSARFHEAVCHPWRGICRRRTSVAVKQN